MQHGFSLERAPSLALPYRENLVWWRRIRARCHSGRSHSDRSALSVPMNQIPGETAKLRLRDPDAIEAAYQAGARTSRHPRGAHER